MAGSIRATLGIWIPTVTSISRGIARTLSFPPQEKNVYPVELEALYRNNPAISEICVLGMPYEDGSDTAIHAVIVPTAPDEATKAEIQQHLQTRAKQLPSYQQFHKSHLWEKCSTQACR